MEKDHPLYPTTQEALLGKVVEECGEVCQVIGKILRFGWTPTWNNITYNNYRDLEKELQDLEKAISYLREALL